MKKLLIITGDTNDADYVTEITDITNVNEGYEMDAMAVIRKVANVVTANHGKWATSEYSGRKHPTEMYADQLTEDDIEIFSEFTPHGEHGIHRIESISILDVTNEEVL